MRRAAVVAATALRTIVAVEAAGAPLMVVEAAEAGIHIAKPQTY